MSWNQILQIDPGSGEPSAATHRRTVRPAARHLAGSAGRRGGACSICKRKTLSSDGESVIVQVNPARRRSTLAKTDARRSPPAPAFCARRTCRPKSGAWRSRILSSCQIRFRFCRCTARSPAANIAHSGSPAASERSCVSPKQSAPIWPHSTTARAAALPPRTIFIFRRRVRPRFRFSGNSRLSRKDTFAPLHKLRPLDPDLRQPRRCRSAGRDRTHARHTFVTSRMQTTSRCSTARVFRCRPPCSRAFPAPPIVRHAISLRAPSTSPSAQPF